MLNPDQKRRILLASVLKPVDEPRMFERMAQSLAKSGFDVFIAGFPPSSSKSIDGIHLVSHEAFKRISLARISARFKILRKALSIRPDIFIITTHELIGVAILLRVFTGRKIVYDIQENYWRNIIYASAWPKLVRPFIAFPVRWKEWITSPFFSAFLLAEKCYQRELSFAQNHSEVIENKCQVPVGFYRKPVNDCIQLIFTGTIAESTGVFGAIDLSKKLHAVDARIRLSIVGHCPQLKTLRKIKADILQSSFIQLIGGESFTSHEKIFEAISSAHFGIIHYPTSPHTKDKIPSKLYEYLACKLPILLQSNKSWASVCAPTQSVIIVDFQNPDIDTILRQIREGTFYSQAPQNADWASEEGLFLTTIRSLL